MTLGVRYDLRLPYSHSNGLISAFDIATGSIVVPDESLSKVSPLMPTGYVKVVGASTAGYSSNLLKTDKNNIAPRVGIAWRPIGANTVFRGGFGIYYDVVPTLLTTTGDLCDHRADVHNSATNPDADDLPTSASGLRQAECRLSSVRRARLTFSRISEALAVQMKGLGLWLCLSMYSPMAIISSSAS